MNEIKTKVSEPKKETADEPVVPRYRVRGMMVEADSPDEAFTKAKKENPDLFKEKKVENTDESDDE